jgi:hypothetical protein
MGRAAAREAVSADVEIILGMGRKAETISLKGCESE